jgi:flagellar biosynthetic protein FliQ
MWRAMRSGPSSWCRRRFWSSALLVGVAISLVQALTQIQEQTLVFVPKILAIFVTLVLALPFMADALHSQMMRISSRIIGG